MIIKFPPIKEVLKIAGDFLKEMMEESDTEGYIVGLSGGLDSSVVAGILKKSKIPFSGIYMPDRAVSDKDERFIEALEEYLGNKIEMFDISIPKKYLIDKLTPGLEKTIAAGNLSARIRMCSLYLMSNSKNLLVAGTSNKSEILIGYFTKWGDGAADIFPIGDLFKTQVFELAKKLNIPEIIINRPPSAGLLPGQTDEADIGIPYSLLDKILYGLLIGADELSIAEEIGVEINIVNEVKNMIRRSKHKRMGLLIPKMASETVGLDFHERW